MPLIVLGVSSLGLLLPFDRIFEISGFRTGGRQRREVGRVLRIGQFTSGARQFDGPLAVTSLIVRCGGQDPGEGVERPRRPGSRLDRSLEIDV